MTSILDRAFCQDESNFANAMDNLIRARTQVCLAKEAVDIEDERYNTVFERIQKETNEDALKKLVEDLSKWGSHLDRAVYVMNMYTEELREATERLYVLMVI